MKNPGRPGIWTPTIKEMECGETILLNTRAEAMSLYVAARRIGGMKISVKKTANGWLCEKICL